MEKYSRFGFAFTKPYLATKGATPVFYVSETSLVAGAYVPSFLITVPSSLTTRTPPTTLKEEFDAYGEEWEQFAAHSRSSAFRNEMFILEMKLHWLFFSRLKFFDSTKDEDHSENFYMEREWRVFGTVPFTIDDIARVILPRSFAKQFHTEVPEYWGQLTFSE
jgi:hypothetical protein